jgi:hypothetical protein
MSVAVQWLAVMVFIVLTNAFRKVSSSTQGQPGRWPMKQKLHSQRVGKKLHRRWAQVRWALWCFFFLLILPYILVAELSKWFCRILVQCILLEKNSPRRKWFPSDKIYETTFFRLPERQGNVAQFKKQLRERMKTIEKKIQEVTLRPKLF